MPELKHTLAFRIVMGAFKDALNGHPTWKDKIPPALPNSVAKRAAGALLAYAGPAGLIASQQSGKKKR